jgi:hypothetical protein
VALNQGNREPNIATVLVVMNFPRVMAPSLHC